MNESPYSFNVKCIDQAGFDAMFTIRDDDGQKFFQRVSNLLAWLPANGFTPTGQRQPPAASPAAPAPAGNVPICKYHGPMKPSKKHAGYYCPHKMGDGSYCTEKAEAPAAPMTQAAAIQYAANGAPPDSYYSQG